MPSPGKTAIREFAKARLQVKLTEAVFISWLNALDFVESPQVRKDFYELNPHTPQVQNLSTLPWLGLCSHSPMAEGIAFSAWAKDKHVESVYASWLETELEHLPVPVREAWTPSGIEDLEIRAKLVEKVENKAAVMSIYNSVYKGNLPAEAKAARAATAARHRAKRSGAERKLVNRLKKEKRAWQAGKMSEKEWAAVKADIDSQIKAMKERQKPQPGRRGEHTHATSQVSWPRSA